MVKNIFKIYKGFVTHNDILKIYRTITIKKIFLEYFEILWKYFRNKCLSK